MDKYCNIAQAPLRVQNHSQRPGSPFSRTQFAPLLETINKNSCTPQLEGDDFGLKNVNKNSMHPHPTILNISNTQVKLR